MVKEMNMILENAAMRLEFDREEGGLVAVANKLTGETYAVTGDTFAVETTAFRRTQQEMRQDEWTATPTGVHARYADTDLTVEVAYELRPGEHFFQKHVAVTFAAATGVTQITVSRPTISLAGIPEEDKAEIRKWLEWGRANARYLMVRHDLFDWPGKGKVDGSAHLIDGQGPIFLFNGTKAEKVAEFALTAESLGFTGTAPVEIRQEYPVSVRRETHRPGATVRWHVPPETVMIVRVVPENAAD
jgi:hypothetical protein